jgi:hypothetical protein
MPQLTSLFQELRTQAGIRQKQQILQIILRLNRPHQGEAIPIFEEMFEHPSDFIFVFYCVRTAFLNLEGLL